ncbi:tetratricopeptide repeat protein [Halomonas cupida]|uniref:tetratricopeptide repeat protein n=1 Tax=Halomonas cupida TaxID=44933 RepID=UPI003A952F77
MFDLRVFYKLIFLVGVLLVFVPGCDGRGGVDVPSDSDFVEMELGGRIYNNDPRASVEDVYGDSSADEIMADVDQGDPYATMLLGLLYSSGSSRYDISLDHEKGLELLEKAWRIGVVDAGYSLFQVYGQQKDQGRSREISVSYLQASAEMGYIKSQLELAEDYFGRGEWDYFSTDYDLAREWYTKAAEQGEIESGIALANIYHEGLGVEKDDSLAFSWMSRVEGMEYGNVSLAFSGLAKMYQEGIGTNINLVQAYKYYDLRGTAGISDKERLSEQMTQEQIQEAIRLSGEWQREHNISMPNSEGYHYR